MPSLQPIADLPKSLHLIEELEQYSTPGHFLHYCTFDQLVDLAKRTYLTFGCSTHVALSTDEKYAREFFNWFLDSSIDVSFHQSNVAQASDDNPTAPGPGDELGDTDGMGREEGDSNEEDNSMGIPHLAEIDIEFGEDQPMLASQEQACGDMLMHNNALLWCDLLHYWEMKHSVKEGDVGQLFKMNKAQKQYPVISYC